MVESTIRKFELRASFGCVETQLGLLQSWGNESDVTALSLNLLAGESDRISGPELLRLISDDFPASLVPPKGRLKQLIGQATEWQNSRCLFHSSDQSSSLFVDHCCERASLPMAEKARLDGHRDEVWFLSVSSCGKFLASASKDKSVCIWRLEGLSPIAVLVGHSEACSYLAWSPDDGHLVSASNDKTALLWRPLTCGDACVGRFARHAESVSAVAWMDTRRFLTGSCDKSVILWSVDGSQLACWKFQGRVQDIALNGSRLLVASSERHVQLIELGEESAWMDEPEMLPERFPVTSITSARRSGHLLVNVSRVPPAVHLWNLDSRRMEQKYVGHAQGRFIVRSCFGGKEEQFVVCGSEDGKIFVWNKIYGALLASFAAHSSVVNTVVWSPNSSPDMLMSCGDDRTVRVWGKLGRTRISSTMNFPTPTEISSPHNT